MIVRLTQIDGKLPNLGPISRVGTLRAAGNAIVPDLAAVFIRTFVSSTNDQKDHPNA